MNCRKCGCHDLAACLHEDGSPCHWAEPDLCSVCAGVPPLKLFEALYPDSEDLGWSEPIAAFGPATAAAANAHRYIAETDAFRIQDQPFVDTVVIREVGKSESARTFRVSGQIEWTVVDLGRV
tara:strand:+ start:671 stop:1039 length:369 start_codon:yes stop_codon:yes gene_type:complete